LNEIGRWSESSAKDESLIPADRVQGRFNERVRLMRFTLALRVTSLLTR